MRSCKGKNKNVFYIGLLSFFGGISQDVFTPILPIYLTTVLGFDKTFVGIAEGAVTATAHLCKVIAGFFSDTFKKQKPIIFAGYFLSMIARLLLIFAASGSAVIGLRAADGMGKGIKDPAKDVLIAGSAEKETRGRNFGVARMLDTLGSVAGPLLLFMLLYFFQDSVSLYHFILIFTAIPLLITLVIIVIKVKEVDKNAGARIHVSTSEKIILPKSFYLFLGIAVLFALGNSSDAFLILRARNLGVSLIEIPLIIALFNFMYAAMAVPLGSLSDRIGRIPILLIGWIAYAAVYAGFAFTSHALAVWLLYGLYGIYYATSEGAAKAFLTDMVAAGHRGKAFGIYGAAIGIAAILASFFAGFLWDRLGPQAPFYFSAGVACMAALLLIIFSQKLKQWQWETVDETHGDH